MKFQRVGKLSSKRELSCDNCTEYLSRDSVKVFETTPKGREYHARCHNLECAKEWARGIREYEG